VLHFYHGRGASGGAPRHLSRPGAPSKNSRLSCSRSLSRKSVSEERNSSRLTSLSSSVTTPTLCATALSSALLQPRIAVTAAAMINGVLGTTSSSPWLQQVAHGEAVGCDLFHIAWAFFPPRLQRHRRWYITCCTWRHSSHPRLTRRWQAPPKTRRPRPLVAGHSSNPVTDAAIDTCQSPPLSQHSRDTCRTLAQSSPLRRSSGSV
jgi:hypothetical protein